MKRLLLGLSLTTSVPVQSQIIYNNTLTDTGFFYGAGEGSIGDRITLSGTERTLTDFSVQMNNAVGQGAPFARAAFTLYLYNVGVDDRVGTEIGTFTLNSGSPVTIVNGLQTLTWTGLNVSVPDSLIWAVYLDDRSSPPPPLVVDYIPAFRLFNPPSAGHSDNSFFYSRPGAPGLAFDSSSVSVGGIGGNHNFYAQISAIPEPCGYALLFGLGLGAFAVYRRHVRSLAS
jgi:hypothetical protein